MAPMYVLVKYVVLPLVDNAGLLTVIVELDMLGDDGVW